MTVIICITELLGALHNMNRPLLLHHPVRGGITHIVLCGMVQNGLPVYKALPADPGTRKHSLTIPCFFWGTYNLPSFLKFFGFLECHFSISFPITVPFYLLPLIAVFPKAHTHLHDLLFSILPGLLCYELKLDLKTMYELRG